MATKKCPTCGMPMDKKCKKCGSGKKMMKKATSKPKLGSGGRFKQLVAKLRGKVKNPAAVAAFIGRKKYGSRKMSMMASAGRKKG